MLSREGTATKIIEDNTMKTLLTTITLLGAMSFCSATETLRMLVWEGYAPQEHRDAFIKLVKEKHGVDLKLEVSHVNGNDDFFPALRDKKTDIFSPSHPVPKDKRWKLIDLKLALPIDLANVPNYKNVLPSLQNADYCTKDGKVYAVPHVRGPYGLAYNTAKIKEAPTSWNILWDSKYKGQYTLGKDAYVHNVSVAALASGIPESKMNDYKTVNNPDIKSKLAELAVNSAPMWEGVDTPEKLKGLSLAIVWGFSLPALAEQGEVWKIAEPKEGTTGWVDNFMLSHTLKDKPKLKLIAEEWLNYTLSDAYQVYDVRGLACAPTTTTVKSKLTKEEVESFNLNNPAHFQENRILWKILDKMDRKGLERLWKNALKQRK